MEDEIPHIIEKTLPGHRKKFPTKLRSEKDFEGQFSILLLESKSEVVKGKPSRMN